MKCTVIQGSQRLTDPEHWRERAQDLRITANLLHDPFAKAGILKIAEGYEALSKQSEEETAPAAEKVLTR